MSDYEDYQDELEDREEEWEEQQEEYEERIEELEERFEDYRERDGSGSSSGEEDEEEGEDDEEEPEPSAGFSGVEGALAGALLGGLAGAHLGGGHGSRDHSMLPHGYSAEHAAGPFGPPTYVNNTAHFVPPPRAANDPYYEYSACSGRRKALLIGINYVGQGEGELRGCHSDAERMQVFLQTRYGFQPQDMVVLMDKPELGPKGQPTRANIIAAMQWLVQDAQKDDSLFFHYSGHGGQVKDEDGDEQDGNDECIYPVDFEAAGEIVDDEMHAIMVSPLQAGTRLTAIYDSCHSGSVLDLPFNYSTSGDVKDPLISEVGRRSLMDAGKKYLSGDQGGALSGLLAFGKQALRERKAKAKAEKEKQSPADVVMFSGCKDNQTSADATEDNTPTGAMSWAFMKTLNEYPEQTYSQLLNTIRDLLKDNHYSQKPQLSSSHPMDLDLIFVA